MGIFAFIVHGSKCELCPARDMGADSARFLQSFRDLNWVCRGDEIGLKREASPRGEAVKLSLTDEV